MKAIPEKTFSRFSGSVARAARRLRMTAVHTLARTNSPAALR
jgi:hypothetical protein